MLPSLVADAIVAAYPWADDRGPFRPTSDPSLGPDQAPNIAMIARLTDAIAPELLPVDPAARVRFEAARGLMAGALAAWSGSPRDGTAARLTSSGATGGKHPVIALLSALRDCPDEFVLKDTPALTFIKDANAREDLRRDASAAFRAYASGDYKAATVMSGSVLEAVLLYRISRVSRAKKARAIAAVLTARPKAKVSADIENWDLIDLIDVATEAGVIDADSRMAAHGARNFRNLIHPGRALRVADRCTKGVALAALGAMQRTLERSDPTA